MKHLIFKMLFMFIGVAALTFSVRAAYIREQKKNDQSLKNILSSDLCVEVDSAEIIPIVNNVKEIRGIWPVFNSVQEQEDLECLVSVFKKAQLKSDNRQGITWLLMTQKKDGRNIFSMLPKEMIVHICSFLSSSYYLEKIGLSNDKIKFTISEMRKEQQKKLNPVDVPILKNSYPIYLSPRNLMVLIGCGFNWTYENDNETICSYGTIGHLRFKLTGECARALKTMHEIKKNISMGLLVFNNNLLCPRKLSDGTLPVSKDLIESMAKLGFPVEDK